MIGITATGMKRSYSNCILIILRRSSQKLALPFLQRVLGQSHCGNNSGSIPTGACIPFENTHHDHTTNLAQTDRMMRWAMIPKIARLYCRPWSIPLFALVLIRRSRRCEAIRLANERGIGNSQWNCISIFDLWFGISHLLPLQQLESVGASQTNKQTKMIILRLSTKCPKIK